MIFLLDTETTGLTSNDEVIELCYIELQENLEDFKQLFKTCKLNIRDYIVHLQQDAYIERFRPSVPIHPKAYECHHIHMKDLISKRPSREIKLPAHMKYMIGHNIQFDHKKLGKPNVDLICTLWLVKFLIRKGKFEAESASLDNLMKILYPQEIEFLCPKHHNAFIDVCKSALVLQKILEIFPGITSWYNLFQFIEVQKKVKK